MSLFPSKEQLVPEQAGAQVCDVELKAVHWPQKQLVCQPPGVTSVLQNPVAWPVVAGQLVIDHTPPTQVHSDSFATSVGPAAHTAQLVLVQGQPGPPDPAS